MSEKGTTLLSHPQPLTVDTLCLPDKSSHTLQSSLSRWAFQPSCKFSDPSWCTDFLFPALCVLCTETDMSKKCVMWILCLIKYARLIMAFPSISVSLHSSPFRHTHLSWRPYLFGAGCFAIKTPWWVLLFPSSTPIGCMQQYSITHLLCFCFLFSPLSCGFFETHPAICILISQRDKFQRGLFFSSLFCIVFLIVPCITFLCDKLDR